MVPTCRQIPSERECPKTKRAVTLLLIHAYSILLFLVDRYLINIRLVHHLHCWVVEGSVMLANAMKQLLLKKCF